MVQELRFLILSGFENVNFGVEPKTKRVKILSVHNKQRKKKFWFLSHHHAVTHHISHLSCLLFLFPLLFILQPFLLLA